MQKSMKKTLSLTTKGFMHKILVFTLTSSLRLLLTLYAWLFVMLTLTNLLLDACLRTVSLESAESAV